MQRTFICLYAVNQRKVGIFSFAVTLSNVDRLSDCCFVVGLRSKFVVK